MKIFIFKSTRDVIKAESALRAAGISCTVIPVPRSVSPLCGMALQIAEQDEEQVESLLVSISISPEVVDRSHVKL